MDQELGCDPCMRRSIVNTAGEEIAALLHRNNHMRGAVDIQPEKLGNRRSQAQRSRRREGLKGQPGVGRHSSLKPWNIGLKSQPLTNQLADW